MRRSPRYTKSQFRQSGIGPEPPWSQPTQAVVESWVLGSPHEHRLMLKIVGAARWQQPLYQLLGDWLTRGIPPTVAMRLLVEGFDQIPIVLRDIRWHTRRALMVKLACRVVAREGLDPSVVGDPETW